MEQLHHHYHLLILFSFLSLTSAFNPNTSILLNCGSASAASAGDGRLFLPDYNSDTLSLSSHSYTPVTNPNPSPSTSPLYRTARAFTGESSYLFKTATAGAHFLRLHFSPFSATSVNLSSAVFSVTALDSFLLLSNFSTTTTTIKEYFVWLLTTELTITFTPTVRSRLAFISAVELFTAPGNLLGGSLSGQVLETVHRINVGGDLILPSNDTLWRTWTPDARFLFNPEVAEELNTTREIRYRADGTVSSPEIAPAVVYRTARRMNVKDIPDPRFNITWLLKVPRGYKYLVRFHFCDFVSKTSSQLVFDVYVGDRSAYQDLQAGSFTGWILDTPFYLDYVTDLAADGDSSSASGNSSREFLLPVSVGRSGRSSPATANAILNGLEILKLNNSVRSLDGEINPYDSDRTRHGSNWKPPLLYSFIAGITLLVLFTATAGALFWIRKRREPAAEPKSWSDRNSGVVVTSTPSKTTTGGTLLVASLRVATNLSLHIAYDEIEAATNGFDEKLVIGFGGFGKVYKGTLADGTEVAVKKFTPGSMQGYPEFQAEIDLLSQIRHRHLVSLVGYCDDRSEMILVYEYVTKGTLKSILHGGNPSSPPWLTWKQRLEICIGAARGIHYLHTGFARGIIHRDVKSSNILLGEDFIAKVSDFGLSRMGPPVGETHVSTAVKGSFGYLDPEYFKTQQLTDKSDVYSFGVVLFEVLCARPATDDSFLSREQLNLAEWAAQWQRKGKIEEIVDKRLLKSEKESGVVVSRKSLKKFGEIAEKCVAEYGVDRPSIGEVLWSLEYALQLQVAEEVRSRRGKEACGKEDGEGDGCGGSSEVNSGGGDDGGRGEEAEVDEEGRLKKVFSQLMTRDGR